MVAKAACFCDLDPNIMGLAAATGAGSGGPGEVLD
jgi:hypothetical protein